jgi:hypothetical protein
MVIILSFQIAIAKNKLITYKQELCRICKKLKQIIFEKSRIQMTHNLVILANLNLEFLFKEK